MRRRDELEAAASQAGSTIVAVCSTASSIAAPSFSNCAWRESKSTLCELAMTPAQPLSSQPTETRSQRSAAAKLYRERSGSLREAVLRARRLQLQHDSRCNAATG